MITQILNTICIQVIINFINMLLTLKIFFFATQLTYTQLIPTHSWCCFLQSLKRAILVIAPRRCEIGLNNIWA